MTDLWYALHVKPRFEKYVETHLAEKGYDVFLPTYTAKRKWSDRVKSISLPLFPSYLFCRFPINSRLPILVTPGVNFIVGVGKTPVAVDEQEIHDIRCVMRSGAGMQPHPYLQVGEMVRVEEGPLEGLTGIILRSKGNDRLLVSVSLLMRSVSVELDRTAVKPYNSALRGKMVELLAGCKETEPDHPLRSAV
jgi:transcription antitermination factor NusG